MRVVILDNEAVQALSDPRHPKHRVVTSHLDVVVERRKRGVAVVPVVPTAVRVEAGWDRAATSAAVINRFRVTDRPLDTGAADEATRLRAAHRVSVVDAHVGQVANAVARSGDQAVVLTSDLSDIATITVAEVRAVRI